MASLLGSLQFYLFHPLTKAMALHTILMKSKLGQIFLGQDFSTPENCYLEKEPSIEDFLLDKLRICLFHQSKAMVHHTIQPMNRQDLIYFHLDFSKQGMPLA